MSKYEWFKKAIGGAAIALGVGGFGMAANAAVIVTEVITGNDCVGVFDGGDGFENCLAPERTLADGSTLDPSWIIAKFDWIDKDADGNDLANPYLNGGAISSRFPTVSASDFTIDVTNPDNPTSGTWSYANNGNVSITSFAVKGGNGFNWYYDDMGAALLSGTWSRDSGFSHISFYDTNGTQIPLPAAAWLLLGGLGALGVASRRRKANAA